MKKRVATRRRLVIELDSPQVFTFHTIEHFEQIRKQIRTVLEILFPYDRLRLDCIIFGRITMVHDESGPILFFGPFTLRVHMTG